MSDITDKVSKLFAGYFDAIEKAADLFGVVSGCAVSGNALGMTVDVASGVIRKGNTTYNVAGGSLAIAAADATYDRYDTVVYDTSTSSLTVLTGTADSDPVPPKPNADQCLLAFVKVTAGATNTSGAVIDYRMFVQGSIDADTVDGVDIPNTIANVLTDHDKAAHDALGIDADTVDGYDAGTGANNVLVLDASGLVPLANIPATLTGKDADSVDGVDLPNTIANVLTDHDKATHDALLIDADTVDSKHASDLETSNLVDQTASRALDTVYQNTTGRYLLVVATVYRSAYGLGTTSSSLGQISSDNVTYVTQSRVSHLFSSTETTADGGTHVLVVPPNYYYKITAGVYTLTSWWEVEI